MKTTLIYISISILLIGCTAKSMGSSDNIITIEPAHNTDQDVEILEETEDDVLPTDIEFCNNLIAELNGIEKYVILGNYNILSAILMYNGDTANSNKVNEVIIKQDGHLNIFNINSLDKNNGYIIYGPIAAEVTYTATYWELKDGSRLICTEESTCGPVCSSSLSFLNYIDGMYSEVENTDVIPEYNTLQKSLLPKYDDLDIETGDPLEFQFLLPKNGKDITYCLDEDCITLQWKNELFLIKQ